MTAVPGEDLLQVAEQLSYDAFAREHRIRTESLAKAMNAHDPAFRMGGIAVATSRLDALYQDNPEAATAFRLKHDEQE